MIKIEDLLLVIGRSNSIKEVLINLGFASTNTAQRNNIRTMIKQNEINISHFGRSRRATSPRWKDDTELKKLAREAKSMGEFLVLVGLSNKGSNYETAKYHFKRLNIDTSHFVKNGNTIRQYNTPAVPLEDILTGKCPTYKTHSLKQRLLKENIKKNVCEECGQEEVWNNKPLVMHLDHIDGNSENHQLHNLRMLCPNCHTQTKTYAGKNKRVH